MNEPDQLPDSELTPWVVFESHHAGASVTLWRLQHDGSAAVALFSQQTRAAAYASENNVPSALVRQLDRSSLIRLLADCYRQGVLHAALDPDASTTRQLFEIRAVLRAARNELAASMRRTD